jgi:hypothetical protein
MIRVAPGFVGPCHSTLTIMLLCVAFYVAEMLPTKPLALNDVADF